LAKAAEAWYERKRPQKKRWGRALRVSALVLGFVGVVLPILAQILTSNGKSEIPPGYTAIALAAAGTVVAFDHYFGFSSAWMRFMAAEMLITRLRDDFDYSWNAILVSAADPPTEAEVKALLDLAHKLVLASTILSPTRPARGWPSFAPDSTSSRRPCRASDARSQPGIQLGPVVFGARATESERVLPQPSVLPGSHLW
jgi:hypothetical protein